MIEISNLKSEISSLLSENTLLKDKIELLEDNLRQFTSSYDMNFDETYEAVLRSEFELMRKKFEKQIAEF